jgi:uncharacterized protein YdeI (YjbR/CyaY-like superfamily)
MIDNVNWFFEKETKWKEANLLLRKIILSCKLQEELKWGKPSYFIDEGKIVLIHSFKDYTALLFFKGVLLQDPKKILIQQTPDVQVARQIRLTSVEEIKKLEGVIKEYILDAIDVEKKGLKHTMKTVQEFDVPQELQDKFDIVPELKTAFEALTPGRQKGYLLYFKAAKQAKTREDRIDKYMVKILSGKGLDD